MKKKQLMSLLVTLMVMMMGMTVSSCVTTRDAAKLNKVELGMTKSDIQHLLGTPLFRNADETGEQWGYRKEVGKVVDPEEIMFVVTFDDEGKVIAYNSVKEFPPHRRL